MFDFDVITGPTSSRPLAPAAKSPPGRAEPAPAQSPGERPGAPPARVEAASLPR